MHWCGMKRNIISHQQTLCVVLQSVHCLSNIVDSLDTADTECFSTSRFFRFPMKVLFSAVICTIHRCNSLSELVRVISQKAFTKISKFMSYFYFEARACVMFRYAVILNGHDTMKETLLKKSIHFAGRVPFFSFKTLYPDRKGKQISVWSSVIKISRTIELSYLIKCYIWKLFNSNDPPFARVEF